VNFAIGEKIMNPLQLKKRRGHPFASDCRQTRWKSSVCSLFILPVSVLISTPDASLFVQPLYDIGAVAMRLLTKYMNKEKVETPIVVLPHHIEKRGSTK